MYSTVYIYIYLLSFIDETSSYPDKQIVYPHSYLLPGKIRSSWRVLSIILIKIILFHQVLCSEVIILEKLTLVVFNQHQLLSFSFCQVSRWAGKFITISWRMQQREINQSQGFQVI